LPDDLHRRLTARAVREGRSLNAVAMELLDRGAEANQGDRRSRLRARAAALGVLRTAPSPAVAPERRSGIIESTRGLGAQLDFEAR
jgi:hypothetical protein